MASRYMWNLGSQDAKYGMKAAAEDWLDSCLPSPDSVQEYLLRIQSECFNYRRPSAWIRGYLLIGILIDYISLEFADSVAHLLSHLGTIDYFPRGWISRSSTECDPMLIAIEAASLFG